METTTSLPLTPSDPASPVSAGAIADGSQVLGAPRHAATNS
jgi:hypothetical protein